MKIIAVEDDKSRIQLTIANYLDKINEYEKKSK